MSVAVPTASDPATVRPAKPAATSMPEATELSAHDEFARQVETLVSAGYPALLGRSEAAFRTSLAPLAESLPAHRVGADRADGVPFVLVLDDPALNAADTVGRTRLGKKAGFTSMTAEDVATFVPQPEYDVPTGAYLLLDIDPGAEFRDVTPDDALPTIVDRGRSPLTIAEGIALITHYPELLRDGHRFSLLASRCGDRRVPALWVSEGRPRLGWCWRAAPHTWLGSASAAARTAVDPGSVRS